MIRKFKLYKNKILCLPPNFLGSFFKKKTIQNALHYILSILLFFWFYMSWQPFHTSICESVSTTSALYTSTTWITLFLLPLLYWYIVRLFPVLLQCCSKHSVGIFWHRIISDQWNHWGSEYMQFKIWTTFSKFHPKTSFHFYQQVSILIFLYSWLY